MFEGADPGVTRSRSEVRYPFLDLRLVDFLLSVPVFPWTYKKRIARRALARKIACGNIVAAKDPNLRRSSQCAIENKD